MQKTKGKYQFNDDERRFFILNYPYTTNKFLAFMLGCSWRTIVRLARKFNLQKSPDFRDSIDFIKIGSLGAIHPNSISTRFIKGIHYSPATEFKKKQT